MGSDREGERLTNQVLGLHLGTRGKEQMVILCPVFETVLKV